MKKTLCVALLVVVMSIPAWGRNQATEPIEKPINLQFQVIVLPAIGPIVGPVVIVVPMNNANKDGDDPEPEEKTWSDIKKLFA